MAKPNLQFDECRRFTVEERYGAIWPWRALNIVRAVLALIVLGSVIISCSGCQSAPQTTFSAERPSRHTVNTKHFVIQSDVKIEATDPIVGELEALQQRITSTLSLPEQRDPVVVYLFSDEVTYRYYMQATWSDLPARRAYFVGTTRELAVYSFRSPRMQEDLRHEFTHGVLHACLETVPLWLDEGLAEYFEIPGEVHGVPHPVHVAELRRAMAEGWQPNLYKLEMTNDFRNLTQRDYAEAWAWVHLMLNSKPMAKDLLLQYVAELKGASMPGRLLPAMEKAMPDYVSSVRNHVMRLEATQPAHLASQRPLPLPNQ